MSNNQTSEEFLDEVLGIFMGEIGLTRSRVEHGYIKPAEAYTENEKTKGKVQQAILQHFQQEQERKVGVSFYKDELELAPLSDDFVEVAESRTDDVNHTPKLYTQSEVDRLIKEAIDDYIKPHLTYCQEQNGMPYCKNCGLSEQESVDN